VPPRRRGVRRSGRLRLRTIAAALLLASGGPTAQAAYRLGPGDEIHVHIYQDKTLTGNYTIGEACEIDLTFFQVKVCGLTTTALADAITGALEPDYFLHPEVGVRIITHGSLQVEVTGEVSSPGIYVIEGPSTVSRVVTLAGGPTAGNVIAVNVQRRGGEFEEYSLLDLSTLSVPIHGGDMVILKSGRFVTVLGEVIQSGMVSYRPDLTVTAALGEAGGTTNVARLRRVRLIRANGDNLLLDVRRITEGREPDVLLNPDDKLVVERALF